MKKPFKPRLMRKQKRLHIKMIDAKLEKEFSRLLKRDV